MGGGLWRKGHGDGIKAGGQRLPLQDPVCQVLQPAGTDFYLERSRRHPDRRYAEPPRAKSRIYHRHHGTQRVPERNGGGTWRACGKCARRPG